MDSDSDEDSILYSTTNVLLGYVEEALPTISSSSTSSADSISHLGGHPTWFTDSQPADSRLAKCQSCNQLMPLLLQLDGNLPESPWHQRLLYIFGCREKRCRRKNGSVRAMRGVKIIGTKDIKGAEEPAKLSEIEHEAEKASQTKMGDLIFGSSSTASNNPFAASSSNANPFASSSLSSTPNPFAPKTASGDLSINALSKTFASVASINAPPSTTSSNKQSSNALIGPPTPWPAQSPIRSYPSFFLDAHYEELEPNTDAITLQAQKLAKNASITTDDDDNDANNEPSSSSSRNKAREEKDTFESTINKTFDHFSQMTSQNPEQVLRYERGGVPLLYSKTDVAGNILSSNSMDRVPRCGHCGAKRVFEVQLMPYAITVLEEAGEVDMLDEGMEWGTIIIATCKADCDLGAGVEVGKEGYSEEWVGVQWEEEMRR